MNNFTVLFWRFIVIICLLPLFSNCTASNTTYATEISAVSLRMIAQLQYLNQQITEVRILADITNPSGYHYVIISTVIGKQRQTWVLTDWRGTETFPHTVVAVNQLGGWQVIPHAMGGLEIRIDPLVIYEVRKQ